jgi:hypothetical protein
LKEGLVMVDNSTSLLDKRSEEVRRRILKEQGGVIQAEAWLATPNPSKEMHGQTPADFFAEHGEGWFLNATCNIHVQEHLRAYLDSKG